MLRRMFALMLCALLLSLPARTLQAQDAPAEKKPEPQEAERKPEAEKKTDKWDVEAEHGPTTLVEFDTDEGTWMSCDVSPDGQRIAFDLLGDIYQMPIGGGRAELLSGGPAWDAQPRYSPDGKWLAFTSDRDGGDNVWVMDATDGRNRRQITKETLRLVNSPDWTPDGRYIVARKHWVDQRSLGAGEIWMYNVSGAGTGLQLTEKSSWTANVGEPAVDPRQRFVYFVNSGNFDYNKNVYESIYWIERYDTEKGRRSTFIRGAGGAIRPAVSPDGKLLSFLRRDRLKTVLYLREIESGREWPVFDNLTRDQQETWSVFGAYPGYSWTPDGRSIVLSAHGKFIRIDVGSKTATPIPFTAHVAQKVTQAVRFAQKVAPERDTTKLLRWAARHGERVIYSALGKLYVKEDAAAAPRPLLNTNYLEYAPAYSPDGKRLAYVTWSDAEKGAVWVANSDGTNAAKITKIADQYANPVFSPDGTKVAYLKGRGSIYHEEDLASESQFEIHYWDGRESRYVLDVQSRGPNARMPRLTFDPKGERVFFVESPPVPTPPTQPANILTYLSSVKLSGDDYKRHVESRFGSEIVPSPDHEWVFFKELHKLYLAPFPQTGKLLKLNATETGLPVKTVSAKSGDWLTWSPDGRILQWTNGENFYEQPAEQVVRQLNKDEKPAEAKQTRIGFEFDTARPKGLVALTNARIITMKGDEVIGRGTILVADNRIKAVGARIDIPAGARRIDMAGKTIMPGIIDVHAHMGYNTLDISPEQQWPYLANLAYGVTTTHDPSASTQLVFAQSEMVKAGRMVGPRVFSTGYILYGAESSEKAPVASLEDARGHLARMKAVGAFSVKSYNQPRRNQRQQIIAAARELRMMVVPEGGSTYFYNMSHILDGHTGIEHAVPVAPLYKDAITLFAKSQTGYTPTLVVGYGGVWGENYWYQKTNVWENEKLLKFTPRGVVDSRARRRMMVPDDDFFHFELAKSVKDVVRAGGRAQLGAHGQLQGLAAHWELWMFGQGGLTPLESIRAATLDGARYLGLDGDLGSIEPGKLADFAILDRNPLQNLQNSDSVSFVMINGVLYDTGNMDEVYPEKRVRPSFFWERAQGPAPEGR
ncbi:MAG: amidohydrolase family protein [Pyrinomonadaceae bacterium]